MALTLPNLGILWPFVLCSIYLVQVSGDDLLDFDFGDVKEIDWSYDAPENSDNPIIDNKPQIKLQKQQEINRNKQIHDNGDDNRASTENQVTHAVFDWHNRILRKALAKVLTNKTQRQKFLEILPILRALSKQQKLALSALISAQINAKNGQELKLDQVRRMFGDDKKLLIPIVYDIANLVRNSAKKYMIYNYDISDDLVEFSKRNVELSSIELDDDNQNVGISSLSSESETNESYNSNDSLEDFIPEQNLSDTVLDAKSINEQIQSMYMKQEMTERDKKQIWDGIKLRRKRSTESEELVHKLTRSIPSSINEEDLLRAAIGRSLKLNTTIFSTSKETKTNENINIASDAIKERERATEKVTIKKSASPSSSSSSSLSSIKPIETYQFIEDLALASLNETEYDDTIGEKIDPTSNSEQDAAAEDYDNDEKLPTPEELISKPRLRIRKIISPVASKVMSNKRKRIPTRVKPKQDSKISVPPPRNCERFTSSMCIKTDDYPLDQIMSSIRRHRNAMVALLAEYNDKWNSIDANDEFNEYTFNKKRREDERPVTGNGMCQSTVRYARPQKARSAAGEWKYIINTDQHTQTLRLEKCTNPQESCSYLNQHYRSHCAQVYNYHRLLSWDKNRGLHVDIFKVPTCCSCQVDGYRSKFTPFTDPKKQYTPIYNEDPYQKDIDYNDDIDEDDDDDHNFDFDYLKHGSSAFDSKEVRLGSKKIRKKVIKPTVGPYLSPPGKEFHEHNAYIHGYDESQPDITSSIVNPSLSLSNSINFLKDLTRRRPFTGYKEARADQEYSPSETEVKKFGTNFAMDDSIHQKRKNIYSVPYIANNDSNNGNTGDNSWVPSIGPTAITANTGSLHTFTPSSPITNPIRQYRLNTNAHKTLPTKHTTTFTGIRTANAARTTGSTTVSTRRNTAYVPADYIKARTNRTNVRLSNRKVSNYEATIKIPYTIAPILITNKTANVSSIEAATTATATATAASNSTTTTTTATAATTSITPIYTNETEQFKASSKQSNLFSINPELFHFHNRHQYNITTSLNETTNTTINNHTTPKRINYNYHPIIDFFEYNNLLTSGTKSSNNNYTNNFKRFNNDEKPLLTATKIKAKNRIHNKIPNNIQYYYPFRYPKGVLSNNKKPNHTIGNFGQRYRYRYDAINNGDNGGSVESNISKLIQPIISAPIINQTNTTKTEVIEKWQPVMVDKDV